MKFKSLLFRYKILVLISSILSFLCSSLLIKYLSDNDLGLYVKSLASIELLVIFSLGSDNELAEAAGYNKNHTDFNLAFLQSFILTVVFSLLYIAIWDRSLIGLLVFLITLTRLSDRLHYFLTGQNKIKNVAIVELAYNLFSFILLLFYLFLSKSVIVEGFLLILFISGTLRFICLYRFSSLIFGEFKKSIHIISRVRYQAYFYSLINRVFPQLERVLLSTIGLNLLGQIHTVSAPFNRVKDFAKSFYKEEFRDKVVRKILSFNIYTSLLISCMLLFLNICLLIFYGKNLNDYYIPIFILSAIVCFVPIVNVASMIDLYFGNGVFTRNLDLTFNLLSIVSVYFFVSGIYSYFYCYGALFFIKLFIQYILIKNKMQKLNG